MVAISTEWFRIRQRQDGSWVLFAQRRFVELNSQEIDQIEADGAEAAMRLAQRLKDQPEDFGDRVLALSS